MIVRKILLMIRRNSMTLLGAAILASGIFYVVNNPNVFMASILSLQEKEFIMAQWRDVAYKADKGVFEVFVADKYTGDLNEFQGMIYLNPEKVDMDIVNYTGKGTIDIQVQEYGSLMIHITDLYDINTSREIISIPFSGDEGLVFLWESQGLINNKRKNFSVGNLSKFITHNK